MPRTDVTDALFDPDYADQLLCVRNVQTVDSGGLARNTPSEVPFWGVVTSGDGDNLDRAPHGERVVGSITVHTAFKLVAGNEEEELTADIVVWRGRSFTVVDVNDYSHYGRGFTAARCEPIKLKG